MSTDPTPFERIGGQPTVDRIIDAFYDGMDTLPEARIIRALHPEDLGSTRAMEEVVTEEIAREWILQKLSQVADWMRNRPAEGG